MPSNKIITNILNAFATSNTGLTHFALGKTVLALHHFVKAKTLLSKACTGVEDKDLQLFSINYANHSDSISFNTALALLASKPAHSFSFFEAIKKSNPKSKNYKFWYRVGQAYLEYIQATRLPNEHRRALFFEALHCFTNSLLCLQSFRIPNSSELSKTLPMLSEDDM